MEVDTSVPEPVRKVILDAGNLDGETLKVSQKMNAKRAQSRKRIKDAGMDSRAYGMGVKVAKMMLQQGEREDFIRDFLITVDVLTKVQGEMFPELAMAAEKRRAKKAVREAAKQKKEGADHTAPDNPRSDPARGGAGGVKGRKKAKDKAPAKTPEQAAADRAEDAADLAGKLREVEAQSHGASPGEHEETGDELIARVARERQADQEQRDGGNVLDSAIDGIKSQSEKSAEALAKTGLA